MIQLDLVVQLSRAMSAPRVEDAVLSGQIEALTPEVLSILRDLDADGRYMLPSNFDESAAIGQSLEIIDVAIPRLRNQFFAETWEALLSHHDFRFVKPGNYFVLETDFYSKDDSDDLYNKQYSDIVALIRLLSDVADADQRPAGQLTLLFLLKEKLELNITYGIVDFRDLHELENWRTEFLIDDPHAEQRKSILKTALSDLLKNIPAEQRFKHLLKVFDELIKRVRENFQLYVIGFSFEKVREEVESNRLEYTLKLNKVFSEIQNQLLAVPAALLLIGSQMDEKLGLALKNWALLVGTFIFTGFMNMLLKNQHHSLEAINLEVIELKHKLEFEHAALAEKLMPAYGELDKRYKQQQKSLRLVEYSVAGVFVFCTFLFGRYGKFW
ncbi:MAG: hypothetical protein ACXWT0_08985 [Methylobacter sp.]